MTSLSEMLGSNVSEQDMLRNMSPIDALKLSVQLGNKLQVPPDVATRNRNQNLRDLLSVIPGPANVLSAQDAFTSAGDMAQSFRQGDYGAAAGNGALTLAGALGAITGLPVGRMAGPIARDAGRTANMGFGPFDKIRSFPRNDGARVFYDEAVQRADDLKNRLASASTEKARTGLKKALTEELETIRRFRTRWLDPDSPDYQRGK